MTTHTDHPLRHFDRTCPGCAEENRFGTAVALLVDAVTLLNNQSDVAKSINAFLETVHPLECGPMAKTEVARPEGGLAKAIRSLVSDGPFDLRDSPKSLVGNIQRLLEEYDSRLPQSQAHQEKP